MGDVLVWGLVTVLEDEMCEVVRQWGGGNGVKGRSYQYGRGPEGRGGQSHVGKCAKTEMGGAGAGKRREIAG